MRVVPLKSWMLIALLAAGSLASPIDRARAQPASPVAGLSGSWAGDGSVWLANGAFERLRCQATYAVGGGGDTLDQTLRCAGQQDSFEFRIELENNGGAILGNWSELTRKVQGGVSGRGANGVIQAVVRGQAFTADVTVATRGARQSVEIRAQGGGFSTASILLRRGR
ncbi:MAG: hypothetical protein ACLPSW_28205 [Roseiarcus sp.]